jgi:hypothetical protein
MLKPFQIIWELIEFGLQALFVYVLVVLIFIGFIAYTIHSLDNPPDKVIYMRADSETTSKMECKRVAGCKILEDGTVEW